MSIPVDNVLAMVEQIRAAPWSHKKYEELTESQRGSLHRMVARGLTGVVHNPQMRDISSPPAQSHDLWEDAVREVVQAEALRNHPIREAIAVPAIEAWLGYAGGSFERELSNTPCDRCAGRIKPESSWDRCAKCDALLCEDCMETFCRVTHRKRHVYRRPHAAKW